MTNAKVQVLASKPNQAQSEHNEVVKDTPRDSTFISMANQNQINWFHTLMLTSIPTVALYGLFTTPVQTPTLILTFLMYLWTGLGITAGYHRLWSHRAYQAVWIVRLLLCIGGAAAFEGSAKWWCRNHRSHHRYTDTEKDPYNAKRGFFFSHIGWMLIKQKANTIGFADITDLQKDPMIQWQHRHYLKIALSSSVLLPVLIGSIWGDARGAYFYAVAARIFFVHHSTFFVNSLAHTLGEQGFSDLHTAVDSVITAVLTLGEGYHNYHHEFPSDYRNAIKFYQYDPTKWLIKGLSLFGLTYNLKCMSMEEIEKARVQMQQREVDVQKAKIAFGKKFDHLPVIAWEDVNKRVSKGEKLVVIDNIVHDVASFVHEHPGGRQTLLNYVGTDATSFFEGKEGSQGNHKHSKEARNYLFAMRIGKLN